jgi:CcmD family protein
VSSGEKYLFGAYAVLFAVVLAYVLIISLKLGRLERELTELAELAGAQEEQREAEKEVAVG